MTINPRMEIVFGVQDFLMPCCDAFWRFLCKNPEWAGDFIHFSQSRLLSVNVKMVLEFFKLNDLSHHSHV